MLKPADPSLWQGRVDAEDGSAGRRWHQQVQFDPGGKPGVALLGLASDLGVKLNQGRTGAAAGPDALRSALAKQAWHFDRPLLDAGNCVADDDLSEVQQCYAGQLQQLLSQQHFVIGLGGGHEIGWAGYSGYRQWLDAESGSKSIGIINFDAHFDVRKPAPHSSSGTPFYQVAQHCEQVGQAFHYCCLGIAPTSNTQALFTTADELGVTYLQDTDCHLDNAIPLLQTLIRSVDCLYVTICLDAIPAALAPGVSAPAALGISPTFIIDCIRRIGRLCRDNHTAWQLADIAELNPQHDIAGRTASLAARLVHEMLASRFSNC